MMKFKKMLKNNKGFTLIELLVVIAILGILIAVALPRYLTSMNEAKMSTCLSNQRMIKSSLETYKTKKLSGYEYVSSSAKFQSLLQDADYFEKVPKCPLDTDTTTSNTSYLGYASDGKTTYGFTCSKDTAHVF